MPNILKRGRVPITKKAAVTACHRKQFAPNEVSPSAAGLEQSEELVMSEELPEPPQPLKAANKKRVNTNFI